ncbi:inositol monophosphatase family protein [Nocardioides lijunqiniae]|uniref:inositol monophosphatase family protein n=1 Tax=Nocardioides lijunqiniae TaxID=2760832 RepID=UPI001878C2DD
MTGDQSDLDLAVAAARAGADVLTAMYGSVLAREQKSATDFATAADLASERAILDVIRAARPGDGFVGEEMGEVGTGDAERVWLVDPLCGTLNFAAVTPAFSVNVALSHAGSTTTAAVSHPPSGEVYWAGDGSFGMLGRDGGQDPGRNQLVDINADGPLDRPFVGAQLAADPGFRSRFSPRVESTTLALAWVAAGQRLGYVTDGRHRDSVHFAAGIALCQAAGCVVTDFDGEAVHTGPGIIAAADTATHAALLELVARHRPA